MNNRKLTPGGAVAAAPPVVPWYLAGGVSAANCVGAYQAIGAASLAESYINLATPGTYDLTIAASETPGWNTAYGWDFVAATPSPLTTGTLIPADNWSVIVRYSDLTTSVNWALVGSRGASNTRFYIIGTANTNVVYGCGASVTVTPAPAAAGVLAVCAHQGYRDGVADGAAIGAWSGTSTFPIYIGAYNNNGSTAQAATVRIQAVAIYNVDIAAYEAAIRTAMLALPF